MRDHNAGGSGSLPPRRGFFQPGGSHFPSRSEGATPRREVIRSAGTFILLIAAVAFLATSARARETKQAERLRQAAQAFQEIMSAPDSGIPQDLLDRSACIVIIPGMKKGGFIFGGRYGRGAVSCRQQQGSGAWGPPSMVLLGGGSFGLQIGGAEVDVIMLVMNPSGIEKLLQDKVTLGADISAAAGPVGRAATAETDAQMNAKILTYSRSRGLFAGLELKGAMLKQDREDNRELYGRDVDAKEILVEGKVATPAAAQPLLDVLSRFSPRLSKKSL